MQCVEPELFRPLELVNLFLYDFLRVIILGPEPLGKDFLEFLVRVLDV